MDKVMSSGVIYSYTLLELWESISKLEIQSRYDALSGRADKSVIDELVAKETSLWGELYPIVNGRSEFGDLATEFKEFECFFFSPNKFFPPNPDKLTITDKQNLKKITKLFKILREVLHRIKITDFEWGQS